MPVIIEFGILRQEGYHEFKANLEFIKKCLKKTRVDKMVQWVKVLSSKGEEPSWISRTYTMKESTPKSCFLTSTHVL